MRGCGGFIPIQTKFKRIQIQFVSKFYRPKKDLPNLENFGTKYGFEDIEKINNFLHRNYFRFEMCFELKLGEINVCFLI
jgi:hypothetical protein